VNIFQKEGKKNFLISGMLDEVALFNFHTIFFFFNKKDLSLFILKCSVFVPRHFSFTYTNFFFFLFLPKINNVIRNVGKKIEKLIFEKKSFSFKFFLFPKVNDF
jgi:hypothetical protein